LAGPVPLAKEIALVSLVNGFPREPIAPFANNRSVYL